MTCVWGGVGMVQGDKDEDGSRFNPLLTIGRCEVVQGKIGSATECNSSRSVAMTAELYV